MRVRAGWGSKRGLLALPAAFGSQRGEADSEDKHKTLLPFLIGCEGHRFDWVEPAQALH